jgi:hypothetical protein
MIATITSVVLLVTLVASIFLLGLIFSYYFNVTSIGRIGLALILGTLLSTYFIFLIYYLAKIDLSLVGLYLTNIGLTILLYIPIRRQVISDFSQLKFNFNFGKFKFSKIEMVLFLLLVFLLTFMLIQASIWPVTEWDAITLYDFRGKLLASEGFGSETLKDSYYLNYPPYTSLLHSFFYLTGLTQVRMWYPLLISSFLLVYYSIIRKYQNKLLSFLAIALFILSPDIFHHSIIPYTNLSHTIFIGLGLIFLWEWVRSKQDNLLTLGLILIGGSTWIRSNDPLFLVALVPVLTGLIIHKKVPKSIIFLPLIFLTQFPWNNFKSIISGGAQSSVSYLNHIYNAWNIKAFIFNAIPVFKHLLKAFKPSLGWLGLLSVFVLTVETKKKNSIYLFIFLTSIFSFLILFGGILVMSVLYDWWNEIVGSITRFSMFLIPLFNYFIMSSSLWNSSKNETKN